MLKVSIIIPIYNAEKYLEECIRSVLCQTLKEIEVICVDDGSTDHSASVVQKLISEDKRVRLFQQGNQGVGSARNLAISNVKGKYLAFLDSADYYLEKNALEKMYEACEISGVRAAVCLHWCINGMIKNVEDDFHELRGNVILDYQDYQMDYHFTNYIFSSELLHENKIQFPNYYRFQDPPFFVRVMDKARKFVTVDSCLYCYRCPELELRFNPEKTVHLLYGLIDNLHFAAEHSLDILFQKTVYRLEYEYRDIILKNIEPGNLEILRLLMEANQIICHQKREPNYIIKPLCMILLYINQYETKLLERIREKDEIVLYGAGRYGQAFLKFLKRNHLFDKVVYIVVSDLKGNEFCIENIQVITLHDLQEKAEMLILVTVREELQSEIKDYLDKNHYYQYEMVKDEFLYAIANEN